MASASLVEQDIKDGEILIRRLDRDKFAVTGAYWFYRPDFDKWELRIETAILATTGPLEAYRRLGKSIKRIAKTRKRVFNLESARVRITDRKDALSCLLRRAVKTVPGIAGIRFSKNTVNGTFVEDAYIYRLT